MYTRISKSSSRYVGYVGPTHTNTNGVKMVTYWLHYNTAADITGHMKLAGNGNLEILITAINHIFDTVEMTEAIKAFQHPSIRRTC